MNCVVFPSFGISFWVKFVVKQIFGKFAAWLKNKL